MKHAQKIQAAVKLLSGHGRQIGCRQLMRLTNCSYHTVQKHSDIWKISWSPSVAGDCSSVVSAPDCISVLPGIAVTKIAPASPRSKTLTSRRLFWKVPPKQPLY